MASHVQQPAAAAAEAPGASSSGRSLVAHPNVPLRYSVAEASSYSGNYHPSNILVDRPHDLTSRWSGASVVSMQSVHTNQYILLQLDRPAVVRRIQFGKYHKAHPCNLADFKVYGWPITWIRLLRAGLRNDNVKEEFDLRWTDEAGIPFACRYIKLVPLAAHQPKFNFSVWYIALSGVRDAPLVASVARAYGLHAEDCTTRLILKHLRERAHWHAFKALLASSGIGNGVCGDAVLAPDGAIEVQQHQQQQQQSRSASAKQLGQHQRPFEHPLLTHLFDSLVKRGAWDEAESWLESAAFGLDAPALASSVTGLHAPTQQPQPPPLFSAYLSRTLPRPRWQPIEPAEPRSADADDAPSPCGRGGHQMCLDSDNGIAYMFGGWDGERDLADFWAYHIHQGTWRLISADAQAQGGPGPRSCHKMCYCPRTGFIYVLGRFVDQDRQLELAAVSTVAAATGHSPDFYRFSTRTGQWTLLSRDTANEGGPRLLYDHQMLVDHESQLLYVFGGRVIHPADPNRIELSGMYRYDVIASKWAFLFDDSTPAPWRIPSRVGHSMLIDTRPSGQRQLWIMSGQRGDRYLTDMWRYDLATGKCSEVTRDYLADGPHAGFTPRAALDSKSHEIYYFTGLVQRRSSNERLRSSFWIYHMDSNTWSLLYEYGGEPQPRYAAQMVFDAPHSTFYMFGGNPADPQAPSIRLDDFWQLTLVRPSVEDVLRQAKFLVRQQRFYEMTKGGKGAGFASPTAMQALTYLQTEVSAVVNHSDEGESTIFRKLMSHLLTSGGGGGGANGSATNPTSPPPPHVEEGRPTELYRQRLRLFNKLLKFFPPDCCEPTGDLCNAVALLSARFAGKA
ncbi:hypothetical protein K437DRAFT_279066 [Tilletiaria anomala UBC 951]|uniref:Uncharacterized protein n=1 Tax=Tilletiaria anomala (strain ATCC 24038 / CBS 436.72 / UBC 951) TaxID=1037660 RepID=A0A066VI83_TILAU|nr:uncharacterized protein K437DRAFT_279066 [Tilletiaria anomala UBC 951]KDN41422.1 hypothetical protein K437DRAFT_279066 [Tilletiaria anomala UBC 951]